MLSEPVDTSRRSGVPFFFSPTARRFDLTSRPQSWSKGVVAITTIEAKSLLRKGKRIDSWFVSRYGMNIYRGCAHDCAYCDGRDERYRVEGTFGRDVAVKVNAPELLRRELDPSRKRKPWRRGFILLGGGVGDSYQPAERRAGVTRAVLEVIEAFGHPVHVLTKSTLVERDLDLLERIDRSHQAIVSMSLSSADDEVSRRFEPGCPSPSARLAALEAAKARGHATGVYLMPVIPFVTDTPAAMTATLTAVKAAGVDFVVFGGMTLKDGRQRHHFLEVLRRYDPELEVELDIVYPPGQRWGNALPEYYEAITIAFSTLARRLGIPQRIPPRLYKDHIDLNDRVVVELDGIDHLLRSTGRRSTYRAAANAVAQLADPIDELRTRGELRRLRGVGPTTERIIKEIIDAGSSSYYATLL